MKKEGEGAVDINAPLSQEDAAAEWATLAKEAAGGEPVANSAEENTQGEDKTQAAAAAPAAAAASAPAAQPDKLDEVLKLARQAAEGVTRLDGRVRGVEGHVGTLKSDLTKVSSEVQAFTAAAKAAPAGSAPSQAQIAAAAKSPEKWEKLKAEFPEIAEATEEFVASTRTELDGRVKQALDAAGKTGAVDLKPINDAISGLQTALSAKDVEIAELHVELKHPGWKQVVVGKEFGEWLSKAPPEVRALSDSDKPSDAIRMLDLFGEAKKSAEEAARVAASRDGRLRSAAAGNVRGQRGAQTAGKSAEEMSAKELWNTEGKAAYESVRGRAG